MGRFQKRIVLIAAFAMLAIIALACAPAPTPTPVPPPPTPVPGPAVVVAAFDTALNGKDADAAANLFAVDAVINSSSGTTSGKEPIRAFLKALVSQNFQFTVAGDRKVEGNKETHMAKVTTDQINKLGIGPL